MRRIIGALTCEPERHQKHSDSRAYGVTRKPAHPMTERLLVARVCAYAEAFGMSHREIDELRHADLN